MDYLDMCSKYTTKLLCGKSRAITRQVLTIFLILSVLHTQVESDDTKNDDQITVRYNVTKEGDAELTCTVNDIGSRRVVIWSKMSDPYPISVGSTRFSPSKKYKIKKMSHNTYVLTVKKVKLEDAGEYLCKVSGREDDIAEVISLNINPVEDSTYMIPKETVIRTEVGQTVTLPCHVGKLGRNLVLWKNGKNKIMSLRRKNFSGWPRFKVIHKVAEEWSLQIKRVEEKDFGSYTCVVNSVPVQTRTVTLKNTARKKTAPILKEDSQYRRKVDADEGDKVTLTCNFEANPPAKVTWKLRTLVNNKRVTVDIGTGRHLTFQSAIPAESGTYLCYGNNGEKPRGIGKTKLTVKATPTTVPPTTTTTMFVPTQPAAPHLYARPEMIQIRRGSDAEFKCIAIGLPRPEIHWIRYGERINPTSKYRMESKNTDRHTITSTLIIRNVSSKDFGQYLCVGKNGLGLQNQRFELQKL